MVNGYSIVQTFIVVSLIAVCSSRDAFPDYTYDNFENDCLNSHNQYRAQHRAPPLQIDRNLVNYAKQRCNLISRYEGLSHGHSGLREGFGENLHWGANSDPAMGTCAQASKSWYDEVSQYNFNNPGFSSSTGHFTQLVWKATGGVGCARCGGKAGQWYETYVVCNYWPAGNAGGGDNYRQNVSPK